MKQSKMAYIYELIDECVENLSSVKHHAVYEHEYKTDEQLKNRCTVEKTAGASCFNEGVDVTEKIIDIIYDSADIVTWLASNSKDVLRVVTLEENCGKKYITNFNHNWNNGSLSCSQIVLFLEKDFDKAGCLIGMHVLTCYLE